MGGIFGPTAAQKTAENAQKQELLQSRQEKIDSLQTDTDQRTRDLIRKYGIAQTS